MTPTARPPAEALAHGGVLLRRWDLAWLDELDAAIVASLPELKRFMPWATDQHTVDDSRGYLNRSAAEWETGETWNYAIVSTEGDLVGSCGLMTRMGPGVLEIGYWVHSAHVGRGHATDAAVALAEAGLRVPGIERVVIKHDEANPASGRVAAKAGFTEVRRNPVTPLAPAQTGVEVEWERRD